MSTAAAPAASANPRYPALLPGAIVALAALLRLHHLGDRSLWTDEGFTWTVAHAPLARIPALCATEDASPPFFYLLTGFLLRLGDSEALLRLVSAIASVGIVLLTYRIARLFTERGTACLAAAVVALSPFQIMYAQEARFYALVALLAIWAFYLFLRAVRDGRRRAWIPYVIVSALGLYTHPIVVLGVLVQAAVVAFDPAARSRALGWLGAQAAAVALYAPWVVSSAGQLTNLVDSHWSMARPTWREAFHIERALLVSPTPLVTPPPGSRWPGLEVVLPQRFAHVLLFAIPAVPLALGAAAMVRRDALGALARAAFLGLLVPLAAVLAGSLIKPMWLPRYFVLLGPFVGILLALGLGALRPRALLTAWTALTLLLAAYGWLRYDADYTKEPWRDVAHAIAQRSDPERTVVLVTFDLDPFDYYNGRGIPLLDAFEVGHPDVPSASAYTPQQLEEMDRATEALTEDADAVWVVVRSPNSDVRREVARRTTEIARRGRTPLAVEHWESVGGPIRIGWFVRGAEPRPGSERVFRRGRSGFEVRGSSP